VIDAVVGIDAGGSSVRVRAVSAAGLTLFEGTGGPGNPVVASDGALRASYAAALAGCPEAARIVACVSGTQSADQRQRVGALLADLTSCREIAVRPDYVAAMKAAPDGTDVLVIAGTGSLVCSRGDDGAYRLSGGRGWILGDHGSAARLGRAALEWYCDDPGAPASEFAAQVAEAVGSADWRQIVRLVSSAASPPELLARAAPVLTTAARAGQDWALTQLSAEMSGLAATTSRHIGRHGPGRGLVEVALAGGVWQSDVARRCYQSALERLGPPPVRLTRSRLSPLDGAVALAAHPGR
jgi:N-acetylglucosamine kinase-like BadF-type ATPase